MKLTNPLRHPFRVGRVEKPCEEGLFNLPNGRRLGFAEYGDPSGAVVLWAAKAHHCCTSGCLISELRRKCVSVPAFTNAAPAWHLSKYGMNGHVCSAVVLRCLLH